MATDKTTKTRPWSKSKTKSKTSNTSTKRSSTGASYSKKSFASMSDQLRRALEREAAASNILRVIASSPNELQTVMDAIAENAARLCEADDVLVRQTDGVTYKTVSHFGSLRHSGDADFCRNRHWAGTRDFRAPHSTCSRYSGSRN